MQGKNSVRRTVFIYLALHTAIIVMLVLLLMRSGFSSDYLFIVLAITAASIVFILYTTHMIVKNINGEAASNEKLTQISASLQAVLVVMGEYARELERRTAIIGKCGKEVEQRVSVITEYSERINELVALAVSSDSGNQNADSAGERKAG